jgi:hypothetical protein
MKIKPFYKLGLVVFSTMLAPIVFSTQAIAHNKVVVIPVAGDDISPDPFAPVAPNRPLTSNYTIGSTTVIDKTTGLEWQKTDDNMQRTWEATSLYCASSTLDGKDDWRAPGILELQSIVDYFEFSATINDTVFPGTNESFYWSASNFPGTSGAWVVNFDFGIVTSSNKGNSHYVRCVR